jgi:hypothetical protein
MLEPLEERNLLTGTWTSLTNMSLSPDGIGTMMLLSDGTVLAQAGGSAGASRAWYKLTPDSSGSYVNGTWSSAASMNLERLYYGSNVLPDGRVFLVGGEYSGPNSQQNFTRTAEIYDPVADTWTNVANFPLTMFGDDPTAVLPDGRVLAGYLLGPQTYIYNPATNLWSQTGTKLINDNSDEETWVKLPDDSVLTYNICPGDPPGCSRGTAQRYIPSTATWVATGSVPVALSNLASGYEIGPAFLLPDGRAIFLGATGNTAYYNPSTDNWTAGPAIPNGLRSEDAPGALLPNGKILFAADQAYFIPPTRVFEFDPTTNTYSNVTPPNSVIDFSGFCFQDRMVMLPTGQVLVATGSSQLAIYTPDGGPSDSWRPTISGITANGDGTFTLVGTQLNGLSEGAAYGDDAEMSTNFPVIRITDASGKVSYARTFNWSNTGVATGATPVTTQFTLPAGVTPGNTYSVQVIASGIASNPLSYNFIGTGPFLNVIPSNNPVTAGVPFTITVRALDSSYNVFTGYRGSVHFDSTDGLATLPSDYTFTAADNGEHTFDVTLATAGIQSITATDVVSGVIGETTVIVITGPVGPSLRDNPADAASFLRQATTPQATRANDGAAPAQPVAVATPVAEPLRHAEVISQEDSLLDLDVDLYFSTAGRHNVFLG